MLPLNGSRLTGFMKCVETWSGSERQLATLCKENHSSNFHTFTDSKSHFIHLCCNDWISWPVLSAFVQEEEWSALVWKRGQWFYETARVTSAVTGRSLRLDTLSFWCVRCEVHVALWGQNIPISTWTVCQAYSWRKSDCLLLLRVCIFTKNLDN